MTPVRIGRGARRVPAGLPQGAIDRDGEQEGDADRGELAMPARLVEPVRIDHGKGGGQLRLGDMMIDDDDVEAGSSCRGERLVRRGAAIDGDDDGGARRLEVEQRRQVGAVALLLAIGDVDRDAATGRLDEALQERCRGRAVDVVITEDGDDLAALDGVGDARGSAVHVLEQAGIGQHLTQPRREEARCVIERDAARGENAPDDLRQAMALGEGERQPLVAGALPPAPPA